MTLLSLVRLSFTDPRAATRLMTGWNLAPSVLWQALVAAVATSVAVEYILLTLVGGTVPPPPTGDVMTDQIMATFTTLYQNPLYMAATQMGLMVITVTAIHLIGRSFGGKGSNEDVLVMITWFQILILGLQIAQFIVAIVLPPLASIVGIGTFVAFFYLLTMFVAQLHGFRSPGLVLVGLILCSIGILMAVTFATAMLGSIFGGGA